MARARLARTLGGLRRARYEPLGVRAEIRRNLARRIEAGAEIFPGIVGYSTTVIPEIENALLAGQDMIILGERGQAKSRLVRLMTTLLDDAIPVVAGCEINDSPHMPVCRACRDRAEVDGDKLRVDWLPRDARYGEKLATPDVSMADLVGDIDPIKVAEGRYLSDELTIHYGVIPRTNRGIFCINELPDLSERIQVGLFNLMEERDVQIKGFRVRLPLDVLIIATANPEDYTNRGRIITPLKDRYGAQVRTHYPRSVADELQIVENERTRFQDAEDRITVPDYMAEIIAELTALARSSPEVNQRSGVSVRISIANYETLHSAALRRVLRQGGKVDSPRVTDLPALVSSMRGKIELESVEEGQETRLIEQLTKRAVHAVFTRRFRQHDFSPLIGKFEQGQTVEVGAAISSKKYLKSVSTIKELRAAVDALGDDMTPAETASAVEFVLEGLHLDRKLNRDQIEGGFAYHAPPPRRPIVDDARPPRRRRREDAGSA